MHELYVAIKPILIIFMTILLLVLCLLRKISVQIEKFCIGILVFIKLFQNLNILYLKSMKEEELEILQLPKRPRGAYAKDKFRNI